MKALARRAAVVAVLDSCYSGLFNTFKGRLPGINPQPQRGALRATLYAYNAETPIRLTASSQDERALEDLAMSGSVFTRYLITGLAGAADSSGDGLVRVSEAFAFAKGATDAHTGFQTPQMPTSRQDPVLTWLTSEARRIMIPTSIWGSIRIESPAAGPTDRTVRALPEANGKPRQRSVAVEPGHYTVYVKETHASGHAQIMLPVDHDLMLERSAFTWRPILAALQKGPSLSNTVTAGYVLSAGYLSQSDSLQGVTGAYLHTFGRLRLGARWALRTTSYARNDQWVVEAFEATVVGTVERVLIMWGPTRLVAGLELGPGYVYQEARRQDAHPVTGTSYLGRYGLRLSMEMDLNQWALVAFSADAGQVAVKADGSLRLPFTAGLGLGAGIHF